MTFNPHRPCPKCGATWKDVRHQPEQTLYGLHIAEHILVTCRTCGYEEWQAPLDASVVAKRERTA